jgi:uncharacterized protein (DUF983 family)
VVLGLVIAIPLLMNAPAWVSLGVVAALVTVLAILEERGRSSSVEAT